MILPTLNNNGSSADDLIQPRMDAMGFLSDAIEALKQATPHGRDYIGDTARCLADMQEHYNRIERIRVLRDELFAEALYIKRGEA